MEGEEEERRERRRTGRGIEEEEEEEERRERRKRGGGEEEKEIQFVTVHFISFCDHESHLPGCFGNASLKKIILCLSRSTEEKYFTYFSDDIMFK